MFLFFFAFVGPASFGAPTTRIKPMSTQDVTAEERARRIKVLVFDVDGVLTDGSIWLFPAPKTDAEVAGHAAAMEGRGGYAMISSTMIEAKAFHAHDGSGVSLARLGGIECAIITKRITEAVALRARDMRVHHVYQDQANKMEAVRRIMAEDGVTLDQIAYLGDDLIDLPVMRVCGLAMAVAVRASRCAKWRTGSRQARVAVARPATRWSFCWSRVGSLSKSSSGT